MFYDWLLILGALSVILFVVSYQFLVGFELKIKMMPIYLLYLIASVIIASGFFSGRELYSISANALLIERSLPALLEWYVRIANWIVFALGVLVIFMSAWSGEEKKSKHANWFFYGLLIFYISNHISHGFLGYTKGFSLNSLYPMAAFFGVWICASRLSIDCIYRHFLHCITLVLIFSYLVLVYKPGVALQGGYESILPAIHFRFWGIASHANALGALLGFFLVFSFCSLHKKDRYEYVVIVLAVIGLVLSQSKTAIVALFISLLVVYLYRITTLNKGLQWFKDPLKRFSFYLFFFVFFVAIIFIFLSMSHTSAVSSGSADAESFTGRSQIWLVALNMWQKNIIFGYGPEIWTLPFRIQINMLFAVTAHNQLLQSLSGAGVLGGGAFIFYLVISWISAFKLAIYTRGLSLGLLVFMLIRSLTESNFMLGLFSSDGLVHYVFLTFMLVALESYKRKDELL